MNIRHLAFYLLNKYAWEESLSIDQPSMDDLPPTVPFITQDEANQNEWNPKTNQNAGTACSTIPPINNRKIIKKEPNFEDEINKLIKLIEEQEK